MGIASIVVNRTALARWARIRTEGIVQVRQAITAEALRQLREELAR